MPNTIFGPGTYYPWDQPPQGAPSTSVPQGMPGPQPAVTPGGGAPAAGGAPGNSIFSNTPSRPNNVYLSPQEQQAIAKAAGYPGATVVGGMAIPQPKLGTGTAGNSVLIDTGEYQVTLQDAQGNNMPVTVTRGNPDDQGNPTWALSDLPKTPPKPTTSPTDYVVKTTDQGVWYPDDINNPGGGYHQILPPGVKNEDDEIKKAVDRQVAEGDRNARERNLAATGIYGTDTEVANIRNQAATQQLNQADLAEKIREFNATQQANDAKQAAQDKVDAANIAYTQARTTGEQATTEATKATTAATLSTTDIAQQKLPGELAQQAATLAGTQASTAGTQASTAQTQQATRIAAAPQLQGGLTNPYITQVNPLTGAVSQNQMNLAYQPKTQAEIAARVGQIQSLMTQKGQEVQAKVGQNGYTAEDALKEFNDWYGQNVASQQQSLQAAQEENQYQRAKDQAATSQAAYQTALGAGNQNISAFNAMVGANPVGPGYADVMNQVRQGKIPTGEQMQSAFTYQAPNPMQTAQQATMDALKYIDPRAAAASGAPPPNLQGIDIAKAFAPSQYLPGAGAPPAAPPPPIAPPAEPAAPAAPPPPALLPPGYAGVPGLDPRLSGATNPWNYAPDYAFA